MKKNTIYTEHPVGEQLILISARQIAEQQKAKEMLEMKKNDKTSCVILSQNIRVQIISSF